MNRILIIAVVALTALIATGVPQVHAGSLSKAALRNLQRQATQRQQAQAIAGRTLTRAELVAFERELVRLDAATVARIRKEYGRYIPRERMAAANRCDVCYLDAEDMALYLQRRHPDLSAAERKSILGVYEQQREAILVNRGTSISRLPSTVTHERLHQLSHPNFQRAMGPRMNEGATELFTQRLSRDIPIAGRPSIYPMERGAMERLAARVGEDRMSRAYFGGDVGQLAREVDAQLGRGAFRTIVVRAERQDWASVNRILERGMR